MKIEITQYSICIPLTKRQWDRLARIDDTGTEKAYHHYQRFIHSLEEAGASNINFNGHFGSNIFFNVEKLEDADKVRQLLQKLLK